MMDTDLQNGWALVVGGSGGIGAAICPALARAGQDVVLTYHRGAERAEEVADRVRSFGVNAETRQLELPGGDPGDQLGLDVLQPTIDAVAVDAVVPIDRGRAASAKNAR